MPLTIPRIEFMREFRVIDSATSASQLRLRLKEHEFEQFGSAFTPEYVYDAIKRVPRFSSMKVRSSEPKSRYASNRY